MQASGQAGGLRRKIGRHITVALAALTVEAAALAAVLLLPRWLAQVVPSISQLFIFFLIGALAGYLAELILRGPRPLGYTGSVLSAMVGAWVGSNLLPGTPTWDWTISTNQGNVPIVTSTSLALLVALIWRALTGLSPLTRRLRRSAVAVQDWLDRSAQTPLDNGLLTGFLLGTTLGWGGLYVHIRHQQAEQASPLTWVWGLALSAAIAYGWWKLLQIGGFRRFGLPLDSWWRLALLGSILGLIIYGLGGLLYQGSAL